jgi:hypothetical protein
MINLKTLAKTIAASNEGVKVSEEQVLEVIEVLCDLFVDNPRVISEMILHGYEGSKAHELYPTPGGRGAVASVKT